MKVSQKISHNHSPAVLGMAMIAGFGLILLVTALALGVIGGAAADGNLIGLLFIVGLGMFFAGIAGWFGLTQPHRHFDDINVPAEDDHHGHDEDHDEHAIIPAEEGHSAHH